MANSSAPVFPISLPHHFSDYGFDPQIDYFHQVVEEARRQYHPRSIDSLHLKLQQSKKMKNSTRAKNKKRRWWKNALHFIKSRWPTHSSRPNGPTSISGPIYLTDSFSGSSTPARKGQGGIPYVSLRELNMGAPPMPIYLVT